MNENPLFNFKEIVNAASGVTLVDELITHVVTDYRLFRTQIRDGKKVKLKCEVGGQEFEPVSIGKSKKAGYVTLLGRDDNGSEFKIYTPIEKVSFQIVIEKPIEPDKEMGYAAILKEFGKQMESVAEEPAK